MAREALRAERWFRRLAPAASIALTVALLNAAGTRIAGDRDVRLLPGAGPPTSYGFFAPEQSRELLFPGLRPYRVTIDGLGLRLTAAHPLEKAPGRFRVLCLGDSHVFGLFVDDEATYPYQLQQALDRRGHGYEVLNAGIGGASIHDAAVYLERAGLQLDPDLVLLTFCANDLSELARAASSIYDRQVADAMPGRWQRAIRWIKSTPLYRAFLIAEVRYKHARWMRQEDPALRRIYVQRSTAPEDVRLAAERTAEPAMLRPGDPEVARHWALYDAQLDRVAALLAARGVRFAVVLHPELLDLVREAPTGYAAPLQRRLRALGVPALDLVPQVRAAGGPRLALYNDPPRDFHFSREGNAVLVQALLAFLDRERLLAPPRRAEAVLH